MYFNLRVLKYFGRFAINGVEGDLYDVIVFFFAKFAKTEFK